MQETVVQFLGQEVPLEKGWLPTAVSLGFPGGSYSKEFTCNTKTWLWSLGWEDNLEEGNPLQYSCLENPHGESLAGCSPWGPKELDTPEQLSTAHSMFRIYIIKYTQKPEHTSRIIQISWWHQTVGLKCICASWTLKLIRKNIYNVFWSLS